MLGDWLRRVMDELWAVQEQLERAKTGFFTGCFNEDQAREIARELEVVWSYISSILPRELPDEMA